MMKEIGSVLEIKVMVLIEDMDRAEASWWYAQAALQDIRHLVGAQQCHRHGPALCGQHPPQDRYMLGSGWILLPLVGTAPDPKVLCQTCHVLWQEKQSSEPIQKVCVPSDQQEHKGPVQQPWYDTEIKRAST
jgi:hypothetical protein